MSKFENFMNRLGFGKAETKNEKTGQTVLSEVGKDETPEQPDVVKSEEDIEKEKEKPTASGGIRRQFAQKCDRSRIAPDNIKMLEPNEVFVFGSNAAGLHGGGAAAYAMRRFGAVWGQGEGLQGQSYAIPTMEGVERMKAAVGRFIQFADQHPDQRFLVTRIGCGIAGYRVRDVAPLFKDCIRLENVALPSDFWEVLGPNLDM